MIDYDSLPTRNSVISNAINDCLKYMYKISYPPSEEIDDYKMHYLPEHIYKMVRDSYLVAYRISPEVIETMDILKDYVKKPYKKADKSNKEILPYYVDYEPMDDDTFNKLSEYIDGFLDTHRWDGEESTFMFNVSNYSPSSNREGVEKILKEKDPNASIPDDSYWDELVDDDMVFEEDDGIIEEDEEDKNI